ncbi:MAG TPA: hypothetical protein VJH95_02105 [Candidatus Nanoarchaeia archaeon]|nr:hypothetical protein [Candidatus Nanoarchaeia archaeon]
MAYGSGVAKNVAKGAGHVVLGLFPEQGFLEEKVGWYNSSNGVFASSAVETLGGLLAAAFFPEYANWLITEAVAGGVRFGLEADKNEMMNVAGRRGAYALEAAYFLGKRAVSGALRVRRMMKDVGDYFTEISDSEL